MEKLHQEKDLHLAKLNQEKEIQMEKLKLELEILKQNEIDKQREHELKKLEVELEAKSKLAQTEKEMELKRTTADIELKLKAEVEQKRLELEIPEVIPIEGIPFVNQSKSNQINLTQHKSNQIKFWFLRRGENGSTRRKTSRSRVENQQTQPTYDTESGNRTRATLVGGERSDTAPTLQQ